MAVGGALDPSLLPRQGSRTSPRRHDVIAAPPIAGTTYTAGTFVCGQHQRTTTIPNAKKHITTATNINSHRSISSIKQCKTYPTDSTHQNVGHKNCRFPRSPALLQPRTARCPPDHLPTTSPSPNRGLEPPERRVRQGNHPRVQEGRHHPQPDEHVRIPLFPFANPLVIAPFLHSKTNISVSPQHPHRRRRPRSWRLRIHADGAS